MIAVVAINNTVIVARSIDPKDAIIGGLNPRGFSATLEILLEAGLEKRRAVSKG
jgi:hypothetical protein